MDTLEFTARTTSHIPDKGQVMVRHSGLSANAHVAWKPPRPRIAYQKVLLAAEASGEYFS